MVERGRSVGQFQNHNKVNVAGKLIGNLIGNFGELKGTDPLNCRLPIRPNSADRSDSSDPIRLIGTSLN